MESLATNLDLFVILKSENNTSFDYEVLFEAVATRLGENLSDEDRVWSTVHKLLLHGADIIASNAVIPIGNLSEEASEARNKDFRRFREHHSRKKSRQASNEDILNMLILSSDPLISASRPSFGAKEKKAFFTETLDLIKFQDTQMEFLDISNVDPDSELESEESDGEDRL